VAAVNLATGTNFVAVYDVCGLFEYLHSINLAAMNDPKAASSRFYPCSTNTKATEASSKLTTAATRARKALDAYNDNNADHAFHYLKLLFGGHFPAR